MNITKYLKEFEGDMRLAGYSEKTISNYLAQTKCFLSAFENAADPKRISERLIKHHLLNDVDATNQRNRHSAVKLFYTLTIHQTLKCRFIPYRRRENKIPDPLTGDQIKAMLDHCQNLKHKAIICLFYGCGLRISEMLNLKIEHINTSGKEKYLFIQAAKGKKDRLVSLPESLLILLRQYYLQYKPKVYLFNGQKDEDGQPYSDSSIQKFLKKYAQLAGITKRVYPHLLRHSYGTDMYDAGVDLNDLQLNMGHASFKSTRIYTRTSRRRLLTLPSPINTIL